MNAIRWRINKYTILATEDLNVIHIPTATVDADEEDYSDLPDLIDCDGNICSRISVGCVPDLEFVGLPD